MGVTRNPRLDGVVPMPINGQITNVTLAETPREFENFMEPEINWVAPEAYLHEFEKLAGRMGDADS